jgi:hypothetical protein
VAIPDSLIVPTTADADAVPAAKNNAHPSTPATASTLEKPIFI